MKISDTGNTTKYKKHYSEKKFWNKLSEVFYKAGKQVVYYALLLFYILRDPGVPIQQKVAIIGALGYFILPLDLIPDVLPLGYTDDLAALQACVDAVQTSITSETEALAKETLDNLFKG